MRYRGRGGKGTGSQGRIEGRNVINMNADYIIKERRNAGVRAVYGGWNTDRGNDLWILTLVNVCKCEHVCENDILLALSHPANDGLRLFIVLVYTLKCVDIYKSVYLYFPAGWKKKCLRTKQQPKMQQLPAK